MKKFASIAVALVLLGGGCFEKRVAVPPAEPPPQQEPGPLDPYLLPAVKFGEEFRLAKNEARVFEDGLTVELMDVEDSRCKPDVQCIWAGELAYLLGVTLTGAEMPKNWQSQLRVSTDRNKSVEANGYVFTLVEGTELVLKLTVTKK